MENNNCTENTKGCVYFFRHIGLNPIKIGYSNNESPIGRFLQFKTYAPYGSEILGFIQTDEAKQIESKLHLKYSNKRLCGEWFEITEEEVNREIDFYSNIEDIKDRNNFQIEWAKNLSNKKEKVVLEVESFEEKKKLFLSEFKNNPKINKSAFAEKNNISRRAIYYWIKNGI